MLEGIRSFHIYKNMTTIASFQMRENAVQTSGERVKAENGVLWLIRESSEKGLITIDTHSWDASQDKWKGTSFRMMLENNNRWENALYVNGSPKAKNNMVPVTSENLAQHIDLLLETLRNDENINLNISNLLNPPLESHHTLSIPKGYLPRSSASTNSTSITTNNTSAESSLPISLAHTITCDITGQPMNDPVVIVKPCQITLNGRICDLKVGKSYERSALIANQITEEHFVSNFALEKVTKRLGSLDANKYELLEEERLMDAALLLQLEDPYILPSGHSFSKETINGMIRGTGLKCPVTQQNYANDVAIPNINLDLFMKAWETCKETLISRLRSESSRLA